MRRDLVLRRTESVTLLYIIARIHRARRIIFAQTLFIGVREVYIIIMILLLYCCIVNYYRRVGFCSIYIIPDGQYSRVCVIFYVYMCNNERIRSCRGGSCAKKTKCEVNRFDTGENDSI